MRKATQQGSPLAKSRPAARRASTDHSVRGLFNAEEWNSMVCGLGLSPQQARIVELLLSGKKDKEISRAMGISNSTIRTYLSRIFARTGIGDRVELLLRVFYSLHQASRPRR